MILTKPVPYERRIMILHVDNFDKPSWDLLSEILDFPIDSICVELVIEGTSHISRVFEEEQDFIPVDKKSILG